MPDTIRATVAAKRSLLAGSGLQDDIWEEVIEFANAAFYRDPKRIDAAARAVQKRVVREWLPKAQATGKEASKPILEAMGQGVRGEVLKGIALSRMQKYHRVNVRAFATSLRAAAGSLRGDIEAAFARAERDGVAERSLMDAMVDADRAEMEQLRIARGKVQATGDKLADTERRLAKAGKRSQPKAKRAYRDAKKQHSAAKRSVKATKSMLARFETRVQGEARDAVRREAHAAQMAHYRQALPKVRNYTWVTVNGADACPSCDGRHGTTQTLSEWNGDGPGDGGTYCGDSCMCALVPADYAASNQGLKEPIKMGPPPDTHRPDVPGQ